MACDYWKCGRPVTAKGLCASHYRQHLRGNGLTEIRSGDLKQIAGMRLSPECVAALIDEGPTAYGAAQKVLERWAKRR
jgi:hypothetical protein